MAKVGALPLLTTDRKLAMMDTPLWTGPVRPADFPPHNTLRNRLMWLRVTCPNGHPLENERLRQAALSKRCPECKATVSLWTKVICPNGHTLKVRTKHGGSRGACPECKGPVSIPAFDIEQFIEDLLPKVAPQVAATSAPAKAARPAAVLQKQDYYARMFKPEISDRPLSCGGCQAVLFPGASVCNSCGQPVA
jgi:hypothetical protein